MGWMICSDKANLLDWVGAIRIWDPDASALSTCEPRSGRRSAMAVVDAGDLAIGRSLLCAVSEVFNSASEVAAAWTGHSLDHHRPPIFLVHPLFTPSKRFSSHLL